jgi:elongation factor G
MREKLGAQPLLLQLPVGTEESFRGIIDLIEMQSMVWSGEDLGMTPEVGAIPAELEAVVQAQRDTLLETVAEYDDELLESYLAGEALDSERVRTAIRRATLRGALVPVLLGSGLRNKGIQPLLDAVVWYLPAPTEVPPIVGVHVQDGTDIARHNNPQEPFAALAFKVAIDQGRRLTYLRLYSGSLEPSAVVYNTRTSTQERVARLLRMFANKRERLDHASAGDIIAVTGLKETTTGDTLCDAEHPLRFEAIPFPEPVLTLALEPMTMAEQPKLAFALEKLLEEDPTLHLTFDEERGQTVLSGMGELHLEVLIRRLRDEFNVQVNVGKPQVVYRETIRGEATVSDTFERDIAGKHHFAGARMAVRAAAQGAGIAFVSQVSDEALVPTEVIAALRQGILDAASSGVIQGYPVVDVQVELQHVTYRPEDSTPLAFGILGGQLFRQALAAAQPVLLEPIMRLEVSVPEEFVGSVIGGLQSRHGIVEGVATRDRLQTIVALVPLATMFGYTTDLRSASQGRGTFTMHFAQYAPVV